MTNREKFIEEIEDLINNEDIILSQEAIEYFNELKEGKASLGGMTENGKKILEFMQTNYTSFNNLFRAKVVGEGLFMSSRSVSGAIRKLVTDGYVKKLGGSPVTYELTDAGKVYKIDQ